MEDDPRIIELRSLGASIGNNVFLGPQVYVERDFASLLTIEDGVVLACGVSVLLHDSALNNVAAEPIKFGQVILRQNCYIGANATIVCGVEIGARAVIGACSLVTHSIPADMVAYGQPARVTGSVHDLIEKHRRLRGSGDGFYYLDLTPWRERRDSCTSSQAAERISSFLARVTGRKNSDQRED